jgi:hypothetical protein
MYTKPIDTVEIKPIDTIEVASSILSRLEMEYKYASAKAVDKLEMIKFLAEQLDRLTEAHLMCWSEALNNISDLGKKHPPSVPEIIQAIRQVEIATRPQLKKLVAKEIPFESIWQNQTDEEHLEDVRAWLEYCPREMPDVMLEWVREQEEDVKAELRRIKKSDMAKRLLK